MSTHTITPMADDDTRGWAKFTTTRLRNGTVLTTWKRDGCTKVTASGPIPAPRKDAWPWTK